MKCGVSSFLFFSVVSVLLCCFVVLERVSSMLLLKSSSVFSRSFIADVVTSVINEGEEKEWGSLVVSSTEDGDEPSGLLFAVM